MAAYDVAVVRVGARYRWTATSTDGFVQSGTGLTYRRAQAKGRRAIRKHIDHRLTKLSVEEQRCQPPRSIP